MRLECVSDASHEPKRGQSQHILCLVQMLSKVKETHVDWPELVLTNILVALHTRYNTIVS